MLSGLWRACTTCFTRAALPPQSLVWAEQDFAGTGVINGSLLFPGECSVTGQSHFKSFDNKYFTFSGICQYLFAKDCVKNSFSVIIETVQV